MNIAFFGATGRVGRILLHHCLDANFHVTALVRDADALTATNANVIVGNVLDEYFVEQTIIDADLVISALGTDGAAVLSSSIDSMIAAMERHHVRRIITIGTAGILQARSNPELYRYLSGESRRKSTNAAEDHLAVYEALAKSDLEWTIVCPTYLPDGERIGTYRVERDFLPDNSPSISIYDTADFAFSLIESRDFLNCRVGIGY